MACEADDRGAAAPVADSLAEGSASLPWRTAMPFSWTRPPVLTWPGALGSPPKTLWVWWSAEWTPSCLASPESDSFFWKSASESVGRTVDSWMMGSEWMTSWTGTTTWTVLCVCVSRWMTLGAKVERSRRQRKGDWQGQLPENDTKGDARGDVLVNVVDDVLLDGRAERRGRLDRLAHRPRVLVGRLEAIEQLGLGGRHLSLDLLDHLGGDDRLVHLVLVNGVGDRLDPVLVVVLW
jgi:hypothetical protein